MLGISFAVYTFILGWGFFTLVEIVTDEAVLCSLTLLSSMLIDAFQGNPH